jgi:hypothetical protein
VAPLRTNCTRSLKSPFLQATCAQLCTASPCQLSLPSTTGSPHRHTLQLLHTIDDLSRSSTFDALTLLRQQVTYIHTTSARLHPRSGPLQSSVRHCRPHRPRTAPCSVSGDRVGSGAYKDGGSESGVCVQGGNGSAQLTRSPPRRWVSHGTATATAVSLALTFVDSHIQDVDPVCHLPWRHPRPRRRLRHSRAALVSPVLWAIAMVEDEETS